MTFSLRRSVLRLPLPVAVLGVTVASIVLALLWMVVLVLAFFGGFDGDWPLYVAICTIVPVLVAAPVSWVVVSLLHEVEGARHAAQTLAWEDELTGVLRRRRFIELVESEIKRSQGLGAPLAVALLDLDDFKHINDTLGHAQGDLVLQQAAAACVSALRPFDLVARWGGEEFAVMLPGADEASALAVAERVRAAVARATVAATGGAGKGCTVSIGVVILMPLPPADFDDALRRADEAMYAAKRAGKNRVVRAACVA